MASTAGSSPVTSANVVSSSISAWRASCTDEYTRVGSAAVALLKPLSAPSRCTAAAGGCGGSFSPSASLEICLGGARRSIPRACWFWSAFVSQPNSYNPC